MTGTGSAAAQTDVRLYIYDTSNGWCAQSASNSKAFRMAASREPEAVDATWALVTTVMTQQALGRPMPPGSGIHLDAEVAAVCMSYLASTLTFEHVCKAYGGPTGHWLALMYRFDNQEPILRPAYLMHPRSLLSRYEVASWAAQAVEHDRNAPGSEVHRLVFGGKGPKLSPMLR